MGKRSWPCTRRRRPPKLREEELAKERQAQKEGEFAALERDGCHLENVEPEEELDDAKKIRWPMSYALNVARLRLIWPIYGKT